MKRRIFKLATMSICAIAMGAACSKKKQDEVAEKSIKELHNPAFCPEMEEGAYKLEDAATTPAKSLTVGKVVDPKDNKRQDWVVRFNGAEELVLNGETTKFKGDRSLTAGCIAKGEFVIAGTGLNKEQIRFTFSKDDKNGVKALKSKDFRYVKSADPIPDLKDLKNTDIPENVTGLPTADDKKPAQAKAPAKPVAPQGQPEKPAAQGQPAPTASPSPSASPAPAAPAAPAAPSAKQ